MREARQAGSGRPGGAIPWGHPINRTAAEQTRTVLWVDAPAVSPHSSLHTVGTRPGNLGDLAASRSRQRQEPQRRRIGNAGTVEGKNVIANQR